MLGSHVRHVSVEHRTPKTHVAPSCSWLTVDGLRTTTHPLGCILLTTCPFRTLPRMPEMKCNDTCNESSGLLEAAMNAELLNAIPSARGDSRE
eukprot:5869701-Amphidinium_carterae.1